MQQLHSAFSRRPSSLPPSAAPSPTPLEALRLLLKVPGLLASVGLDASLLTFQDDADLPALLRDGLLESLVLVGALPPGTPALVAVPYEMHTVRPRSSVTHTQRTVRLLVLAWAHAPRRPFADHNKLAGDGVLKAAVASYVCP